MPESESFDAFYARTVWNVTSQMHALAGQDSAADHAIREAYAQAYQQWYQIADLPDSESWVLAAAKEAYQRRRPEAAATPTAPTATGRDSFSWPGLYRPRSPAGTPADPAATIGSPLLGMPATPTAGNAGRPAALAGGLASASAGPPGSDHADRASQGGVGVVPGPTNGVTAALPGAGYAAPPTGPASPRQPGRPAGPGSRGRMIALAVAVALIVAGGVVYLVTASHPARPPAKTNATTRHQGQVMLPAGKSGTITAIPWSLVEKAQGWTLAEVSSAPAGTSQPGAVTTYLVDPEGGRYTIQTSSPSITPQLLAWSGNGFYALFAVPAGSAGSDATYEILSLHSGAITQLQLPQGVTAVGFSRPDGQNIVAVKTNPDAFKLQRYDLQGTFQATIGQLPRKPTSPQWAPGCVTECGALSSPDGTTDVWGVSGDEMQLVGNALPEKVITRLKVPGGDFCVPLAWQDDATVLASCSVTGQPSASQLWLVPTNGGQPTPVTSPAGSATGAGFATGAWQGAGGATYVTVTSFNECQEAASGPGGLAVVPVSGQSLQQPITVQGGATNNHNSVVSVSGGKLLVLAQTSCPGTSSLLEVDPSTGAATTMLAGQAGQVGVLAAVPYGGLGPTSTNGR